MGLVGVLGVGLHSLVHAISGRIDCWRYHVAVCCSAENNDVAAAEDAGKSVEKRANDGRADCTICMLLARYHAPPVTTATFKTTALLHAAVDHNETLLFRRTTARAHRPRGPPSWT